MIYMKFNKVYMNITIFYMCIAFCFPNIVLLDMQDGWRCNNVVHGQTNEALNCDATKWD